MSGIKETLEVIEGAKGMACDSIIALKDGVQFEDANVILKNFETLKVAIDGIDQVGSEVKDLDADEIKQLVSAGIDMVYAILDALKPVEA